MGVNNGGAENAGVEKAGVNNLHGVATQQCTGRELNLQPLDHKSHSTPYHHTTEPPKGF